MAGARTIALGLLGCLVASACGRSGPLAPAEPDAWVGELDSGQIAPSDADPMTSPRDAAVIDAAPRLAIRALALSSGRRHTCAILEDHSVKCWGDNSYGQLGLGDNRPRGLTAADMGDALPRVDLGTGRTAIAIAAGHYTTCAILDDESLKCWGLAAGAGLPAETAAELGYGDAPGEMGDALPAIDLGGSKPKRVVVGYNDTCVELDSGFVRCWAAIDTKIDLRPPSERTLIELAPDRSTIGLLDDGSVVAFTSSGVRRVGPNLEGVRAVLVSGNRGQSCAVLAEGGLACDSGLLSGPSSNAQDLFVAEEGPVCWLRADGEVSCRGANGFIVPRWSDATLDDGGAHVALGMPVRAIAGGGDVHACALLVDGSVKCWPWSDPAALRDLASTLGGPGPTDPRTWPAVDLGTRAAP